MADEIKFETIEDLPPMVISSGLMLVNKTGGWRSVRPVIDAEKCTSCMVCWKFCPDACITPGDSRGGVEPLPYINLDYCKGCGICAEECPRDAIALVEEGK
jgi:2-oxoacid:acceptor oxidoreductase delta subunit (pyruvate/2-ketoisovalerate family)